MSQALLVGPVAFGKASDPVVLARGDIGVVGGCNGADCESQGESEVEGVLEWGTHCRLRDVLLGGGWIGAACGGTAMLVAVWRCMAMVEER